MHEMRILLKIEFKRLLKSKMLYISLLIGIIITMGAFVDKAVPHMDILNGYNGNVASYPFSVFNSWMGMFIGFDPFATAYVYVCMLICSLPYCGLFVRDNNNQYILQYYSRASKNKVNSAKFIVTFVSGGLIVLIPVVVNLLATMMFIPALLPVENGLFIASGKSIMSCLFVNKPFVYTFIYLLQFFIYGGAFSVVSLAVSFIFDNYFLVLISQFVSYYAVGVISTVLKNLFGFYTFNPMALISPSYILMDIGLIGFILEPIIIILLSGLIFFKKGAQNEVL